MAVTLRGTPNGTNNASGTTNVVTKPTGVVSGDILILDVGWGPTGTTATPPAGFALLQSTALSDNSWTQSLYWKIAGGSEPSTYTTTFSGSTFSDTVMIAYQGADPAATPLSSANGGTGTTETGLGLTFTVAGSILLHCTVSNTGPRTSGPATMTNEIIFDGNIYIDDEAVGSGASGNRTSVYPSQIWLSQMVGIQPVASAAANPPPNKPRVPASIDDGVTRTVRVGIAALLAAAVPQVDQPPPIRRAQIAEIAPDSQAPRRLGVAAVSAAAPVVNSPIPNRRQPIADQDAPISLQPRPGIAAVTATTPAAVAQVPWSRPFLASGEPYASPQQRLGIATLIATTAVLVQPPPVRTAIPAMDPDWTPAPRRIGIAAILAPTPSQPRYIPSTNGRYHIDRLTGQPFPILADSGWVLPNNLNLTDTAQYLDDRVQKGYTAIIVQLMALGSAAGTTSGPADSGGHLPFTLNSSGGSYTGTTGTADFSTPNDTYWAYVRSVIDMITARGLLPICYSTFWGFAGDGVQGCATDITNSVNTAGVCTAFGTYLATGHGAFSGFQSVTEAWFADGGDYGANNASPPSATLKTRTLAIAAGMRAAGCTHLRYFDGQSPSMGTDEASFTNECQTQAVYTYGGTFSNDGPTSPALHTYQQSRLGWNYSPVAVSQGPYGATAAPSALPAWLKETVYAWDTSVEGRTVTRGEVRKAEYWAWLSGCTAGRAHGSAKIWDFLTGGVWQAALGDAYELDAGRLNTLFQSVRWWDLVPSEQSGLRRLIPSANGTQTGAPDGYVAAAQSTDGTQLIAFVPSLSTGTQTFTVDLRSMVGASRARWWDPTSGAFTDAGTFANSLSAQSFTTPGTNAGSDNDWILLFDAIPDPPPAHKPLPAWPEPDPPPVKRPGVAAILGVAPVVNAPIPNRPRVIAVTPADSDWTQARRPGIAALLPIVPSALLATGGFSIDGTAALLGTGVAAGSGGVSVGGTGALVGSAALAGSGGTTIAATGGSTGSAVLAATGGLTASGTADLKAAGVAATSGGLAIAGTGAALGTGAPAGTGVLSSGGTGAATGTGTAAGTGGQSLSGTAGLLGTGAPTGSGGPTIAGTGGALGTDVLSASGGLAIDGTGSLSAGGGIGGLTVGGTGALLGTGVLQATGGLSASGTADLHVAGVAAASGGLALAATAPLASSGALVGSGGSTLAGAASATGTAAPAATGGPALSGTGGPAGTGKLASTGGLAIDGTAFTGGSISGTGGPTIAATGTATGPGVLAAAGGLTTGGTAALVGGNAPLTGTAGVAISGSATLSDLAVLGASGGLAIAGTASTGPGPQVPRSAIGSGPTRVRRP